MSPIVQGAISLINARFIDFHAQFLVDCAFISTIPLRNVFILIWMGVANLIQITR